MQVHRNYSFYFYLGMVLIGCLLLGMCINHGIHEIWQKHLAEKILLNKVDDAKAIVMRTMQAKTAPKLNMDNTLLDTANAISYLMPFFDMQNIEIEKIQFLKIKTVEGVNVLPIKIKAVSQFSAFYNLLMTLNESHCPVVLNDFDFEQDQQGVVVAQLQFYLFGLRFN